MPLYEYQCKKCGHRFEKIQSFSAEPLKECPVCQGEIERLISAPAVQFKGSGFYSTDYGAKPSSKPAEASGDSSSKPAPANGTAGAASPAKSDSKPANPSSSASTDKSS
jgi:putative FmdB family regulatory protein